MAISEDKVRTLITLTKDEKKRLELLAKRDNRSLSSYIANVLRNHINEINELTTIENNSNPNIYDITNEQTTVSNNFDINTDNTNKDKIKEYLKDIIFQMIMEDLPNEMVSKYISRTDSFKSNEDN